VQKKVNTFCYKIFNCRLLILVHYRPLACYSNWSIDCR